MEKSTGKFVNRVLELFMQNTNKDASMLYAKLLLNKLCHPLANITPCFLQLKSCVMTIMNFIAKVLLKYECKKNCLDMSNIV